jgi:uncharacterized protein (DUF433 family)
MAGRFNGKNTVQRVRYNPLEIPNYTMEEGARYTHVPLNTLWYWVIGDSGTAPLTTVYSRRPLLLSFKNLVECFVLQSLRNTHGISMKSIRHSVGQLRHEVPSKYPLADYQMSTAKGRVYMELDGDTNMLVNLSSASGQRAFMDILAPFLRRVERSPKGISEKLFPFTRREHQKAPDKAPSVVVIDPRIAFGKPVLVDSRISTAFLLSRRRGGTSIANLARDYGRDEAEIEEAIYLEQPKAA